MRLRKSFLSAVLTAVAMLSLVVTLAAVLTGCGGGGGGTGTPNGGPVYNPTLTESSGDTLTGINSPTPTVTPSPMPTPSGSPTPTAKPTVIGQDTETIVGSADVIIELTFTGDAPSSATVNGSTATVTTIANKASVIVPGTTAQGEVDIQITNSKGASEVVCVAKEGLETAAPGTSAVLINSAYAGGQIVLSGSTLALSSINGVALFSATTGAPGPTINVANVGPGDTTPDGQTFWFTVDTVSGGNIMSVSIAGVNSALFPVGINATHLAVVDANTVLVSANNGPLVRAFDGSGNHIAGGDYTLPYNPQGLAYHRNARSIVVEDQVGVVHRYLTKGYTTPFDLPVPNFTAPAAPAALHIVPNTCMLLVPNTAVGGTGKCVRLNDGIVPWSARLLDPTAVLDDMAVGGGQVFITTNKNGGRVEAAPSL